MNSWLVWLVFVIAFAMLGFVGYHFSVRTLRFFAAALGAAVIVVVTRYGITHPAPPAANLVNSFTRGFNDLSTALIQPLLPGRRIPAPGQTGWLVIIVALIFAYRELEVWAMHWEPPAIDTSVLDGDRPASQASGAPGEPDEGTTDSQRHDSLVAELRFRLPAVEVRAPAILPGGTRPNGLASIAENSGVTGSGLAGAIIRFVGMLWPNPRRYQVRAWIEHGQRSAGGEEQGTRVTVDLEDPRMGGSIATKTLSVGDFGQAASVVAGYVAGHIFRTDPTTPPWCVGSFAGDDLAAMLIAGQQRVLTAFPEDVRASRHAQISILERSRLDSGVARYELAQLHDLAGNHVAALRLHAMNREDYRRFYRGRYRLGMSLEMVAHPEFELPDEVAATDMAECLRILDRCWVTRGPAGRYDDIMPGKLGRELRQELLAAAQDELRAVRQQLTLWRVIWAMLWHRDEREIRKPYWRLRERQSFHDGARVAELLVAVRQCLLEAESGGRLGDRYGHHEKRALHVANAIAGDCPEIKALLKAAGTPQAACARPDWQPPRHATETRWLPGQCRTPSWQAAYNLACVYAALAPGCADSAKTDARAARDAWAEPVVISLTRVVNDRECEMERPWDWISTDPDFSAVRSSPVFTGFLRRQERRDYPVDSRNCVFCRSAAPAIKITREQIFPNWISQVLRPAVTAPEFGCEHTILRDRPPDAVRTWSATEVADHACRVICAPCSSGWMARLEEAVRPLITPVIEGAPSGVELTAGEQITVVTWAAVRAAVFEYLWTDDPVLTATDLHTLRTRNRPPSGVQVRLEAAGPDACPLGAYGRVYELRGGLGRAFCLTMTVGCLAVQVIGRSGHLDAGFPGISLQARQ